MGIQSGPMEASAMMNCFRGWCNRLIGWVEGRREHSASHDSLQPNKRPLVRTLSRRTTVVVAGLALELLGGGVGVDVRAGCMILISPVATFSAVHASLPTGE